MALSGPLVCVQKVRLLGDFWVSLEFENSTKKKVNLDLFLHGPVFETIRQNQPVFRQIYIENGMITWPNGADIEPDVLYYDLQPAWIEAQELEEATV